MKYLSHTKHIYGIQSDVWRENDFTERNFLCPANWHKFNVAANVFPNAQVMLGDIFPLAG